MLLDGNIYCIRLLILSWYYNMRIRTITVDKKGAVFSTKIFLSLGILLSLWLAWEPVKAFFLTFDEDEKTVVQEEIAHKDVKEEPMIEGPYVAISLNTQEVALHTATGSEEYLTVVHFPRVDSLECLSEGVYTVERKVKMELSTVTMTRFPFFVSFGNGCAFHGAPTDGEGDTLSQEYDGSMIELDSSHAERLYNFVKAGSPVVVTGEYLSFVKEAIATSSVSVHSDEFPAASARAFAIVDVSNGQVFLDKNEDERYPIASVTKLVTTLVASEIIGTDEEVLAPNGERYTLGDLFYPLLLHSDNEVARMIALHGETTYFFNSMNAYVEALGMKSTSFSDASGLSPKNISTVHDLTKLAQHLYTEKSFVLDITKEDGVTIVSTNGEQWFIKNQNKLASDPHFRGGKLGYTDEAGQTSVSIFTVPLRGEVHPIAVIVLNSKDWKQDTRTLLKWLVENVK